MTDQSRLSWALVLSILLHGLVLSLLPLLRRARLELPPPPSFLDVDLVSLPPPRPAAPPAPAAPAPAPPVLIPERQIVSPPDAGEEKEPENARLLSDRNNTVEQETVHRGEPAAGNPDARPVQPAPEPVKRAKAEPRQAPSKPAPARKKENTQLAALPKLDQLLPAAGDLIREGLVKPKPAAPAPAPEQEASAQRTDLLRHGDPWRSGSLRGGVLDFLPTVREGDVTLLNTKAEQFAPFVRRVGMRVLQNFLIGLRRSIDRRSEGSQEFSSIEAVMDKQGNLVRITAKDRSASAVLGTDRSLQAACHEGCFDRNPPSGAEAADGNIHFVFNAQVVLAVDPAGRPVRYGWFFSAGLL